MKHQTGGLGGEVLYVVTYLTYMPDCWISFQFKLRTLRL